MEPAQNNEIRLDLFNVQHTVLIAGLLRKAQAVSFIECAEHSKELKLDLISHILTGDYIYGMSFSNNVKKCLS